MTASAFPFDAGAGANSQEAQWMQMARYWRFTGVIPSTGLSRIGGSLNDPQTVASELQVYADSSGMQVKLHYGRAWIQGVYYDLPVGDDGTVLAIAANASGNPRIDRVVLRVDWSANTVTPTVITGTTAVTPSAPAVTQTFASTWDLPLAQVRVASGLATIASNLVDDERQWPSHIPTGTLLTMAAPAAGLLRGYLPCDGRAVSRITYADLYAAISTAFGTGDGSTTFNVPDARDRALIGFTDLGSYLGTDAGNPSPTRIGGVTIGATGGASTVTLTTTELPAHTHAVGTLAVAQSLGESATHHHAVGTLAVGQSLGESVSHHHGVGTLAVGTSGGETVAHHHAVGTLAVGTSGGESAVHHHAVGTLAVGTSGANSVSHTHTYSSTSGANSVDHTHTVDPASTASGAGSSHLHGSVVTAVATTTLSYTTGASLATVAIGSTSGNSGAEAAHTHNTDIASTTSSGASASHTHAISGTSDTNSVSHTHTGGTVTGVTADDATDHTHTGGTVSGTTADDTTDHFHPAGAVSGITAEDLTDHTHPAGNITGVTADDVTDHTHPAGAISGSVASTGSGAAFSVKQPYLAVNVWIKT